MNNGPFPSVIIWVVRPAIAETEIRKRRETQIWGEICWWGLRFALHKVLLGHPWANVSRPCSPGCRVGSQSWGPEGTPRTIVTPWPWLRTLMPLDEQCCLCHVSTALRVRAQLCGAEERMQGTLWHGCSSLWNWMREYAAACMRPEAGTLVPEHYSNSSRNLG